MLCSILTFPSSYLKETFICQVTSCSWKFWHFHVMQKFCPFLILNNMSEWAVSLLNALKPFRLTLTFEAEPLSWQWSLCHGDCHQCLVYQAHASKTHFTKPFSFVHFETLTSESFSRGETKATGEEKKTKKLLLTLLAWKDLERLLGFCFTLQIPARVNQRACYYP